MVHSSYESSNLDESHGSKIVSMALLLIVLLLFKYLNIMLINSESSDWISMIFA